MSGQAGKQVAPVKCKGWAVEKPALKWSTDAVRLSDVTVPAPDPTQIRVRVYAASINPVDWKRVMFPASGSGPGVAGSALKGFKGMHHKPPNYPYPYVVGVDGAGEVESVGRKVTGLKAGDRVMFHSSLTNAHGGSLCEYAVMEESVAVPIPADGARPFSYEEAAAIPCATWTAYVALFDKLRIEPGRSIFVDGASGAVGSCAVQLAHHMGLYVFASCSPSNADYVRSIGADQVLNYHDGIEMVDQILDATEGYGVDYYLAVTNTQDAESFTDALRFGGAVCLLSGVLIPNSNVLFRRQLSVHYVFLNGLHGHPLTRPQLRYIGDQVAKLYQSGAFRLDVEVLPFAEAAKALDRSATGNVNHKKLIVQVASP
ncbi:zinc binding dehydrogenase-like protein [Leishmania major strain Friedlin]|uniref:Zinc binding dehydrogenase-like protein n=2 Tax=Leishmania major TaxID=5664 RepID=Q4QHF9_LEIMA|nr:zinc binding dehydrogenase-like protein [Leishmania major strain Friedlin]CAG9570037.1 zinc_binding_dehydrogenase-like_protein [Leishmania major strain Friedlin]CAJ02656.1 zinc binding dehydrogenase-like protein [Leishmania major strain Friedlin]|eukprot:XP_001681389.1 zinc binding dehydrogenase-like protein [Leishmania major strain Friedlin]